MTPMVSGPEALVSWLLEQRARDSAVLAAGFGGDSACAPIWVIRRADAGPHQLPATAGARPVGVLPAPPAPVRLAPDAQARPRRVQVGGRPAGTMGAVVHDLEGRPCMLGNAHVLVPAGMAVPAAGEGPRPAISPAQDIAVFEGPPLGRRVHTASVHRFAPLVPVERGYNLLDGAAARLLRPEASAAPGLGPITGMVTHPRPGLRVRKLGMGSSRLVRGAVLLRGAAAVLDSHDYGTAGCGERFVFADQLIANVDQAGGDSGALLVDDDGRAVGLTHARLPGGLALAAPADCVAKSLGVRFG